MTVLAVLGGGASLGESNLTARPYFYQGREGFMQGEWHCRSPYLLSHVNNLVAAQRT